MKVEARVGAIFLIAVAIVVMFAYVIGSFTPFAQSHELTILYNYAGGIEVGSSVRVMGIKVGKVEFIEFDPSAKDAVGNEVKLKMRITVSQKAWPTVRRDSKFFINIAGLIGEKFLEITPGTSTEPEFNPGDLVRGEDPPRVDQLISQSYGLAGKLIEMVDKNEGGVTRTLETLDKLVTNLNKTLIQMEKTTKNVEVAKILKNMEQITSDLAYLSAKTRTPEGQKTLQLLHSLIWRLESLDGPSIKKFLQEEGIRAKLF